MILPVPMLVLTVALIVGLVLGSLIEQAHRKVHTKLLPPELPAVWIPVLAPEVLTEAGRQLCSEGQAYRTATLLPLCRKYRLTWDGRKLSGANGDYLAPHGRLIHYKELGPVFNKLSTELCLPVWEDQHYRSGVQEHKMLFGAFVPPVTKQDY